MLNWDNKWRNINDNNVVLDTYTFEQKILMPKAEQYMKYDELLAEFIMKTDKSYLPDWKKLKQAFWEFCYDEALDTLRQYWEEIEVVAE